MTHAQKSEEQTKKHGDAVEEATGSGRQSQAGKNAVPPAEKGGHPRSAAAHLHETQHIADNGLDGGRGHIPPSQVNALREPPQEVSRIGKEHRKQ